MLLRHESPRSIAKAVSSLNEDAFLIGFARRFVAYKRPRLLFSDLEYLAKILNNPSRPVLIFVAGKAHPHDSGGIGFIKLIMEISRRTEFRNKVFFLEDYDMNLAKLLVQGVDLWLNTPDRGKEASGTSGMKALLNGVVNFSIADGWWAEAHSDSIGWTIDSERIY